MSDLRATDAVEARTRAFVVEHGDPFQRRALAALLGDASPDALRAELAGHQDARGAIAAPEGGAADLASTLAALELLDAVGCLDGPPAAGALAFVGAAQGEDGSWPEATGAGKDEARRVSRTGLVASLLARSTEVSPAVLGRAVACLERAWSVESVQAGDFERIAACVGVFGQLPSELADEALQWCGRELERGFRSGACDVLTVARIFLRCGAPALPGAALSAAEVSEALLRAQQADGGWPGAAERERVAASLDALRALRLLGRARLGSC